MSAQYTSKTGIVNRRPSELYMSFVDMRSFLAMLPEDKKQGITATYDTISANVQGFHIGLKVVRREPFSLIRIEDDGAPFHFSLELHFSEHAPVQTEFSIVADADLNVMMKMMLGKKIQEALDQIVDQLSAI